MGDRKLLKLAAKAAGIGDLFFVKRGKTRKDVWAPHGRWNPLEDDGDALRLAVKLEISLVRHNRKDWDNLPWIKTNVLVEGSDCTYIQLPLRTKRKAIRAKIDNCKVYRRAIVTAAAELGKKVEREKKCV